MLSCWFVKQPYLYRARLQKKIQTLLAMLFYVKNCSFRVRARGKATDFAWFPLRHQLTLVENEHSFFDTHALREFLKFLLR